MPFLSGLILQKTRLQRKSKKNRRVWTLFKVSKIEIFLPVVFSRLTLQGGRWQGLTYNLHHLVPHFLPYTAHQSHRAQAGHSDNFKAGNKMTADSEPLLLGEWNSFFIIVLTQKRREQVATFLQFSSNMKLICWIQKLYTHIFQFPFSEYQDWGCFNLAIGRAQEVSGLVCVCAKSLQLCLILCDPVDYSPSGFSVHGILQARILEWVAISSSRGSSQSWDQAHVSCGSCIAGRFCVESLGKPKFWFRNF